MKLLLLFIFFSTFFANSFFAGDKGSGAQAIRGQKTHDQEIGVIGQNGQREVGQKKQKSVEIEEDQKSDGGDQEQTSIASILNQLNLGLGWWG